jgi:hypothetical protein
MTSAGPTARANDKKKGSRLVFGSDGTRVLDRGENFSVALNNFADSDRLFFSSHHLFFFTLQASGRSSNTAVSAT